MAPTQAAAPVLVEATPSLPPGTPASSPLVIAPAPVAAATTTSAAADSGPASMPLWLAAPLLLGLAAAGGLAWSWRNPKMSAHRDGRRQPAQRRDSRVDPPQDEPRGDVTPV